MLQDLNELFRQTKTTRREVAEQGASMLLVWHREGEGSAIAQMLSQNKGSDRF